MEQTSVDVILTQPIGTVAAPVMPQPIEVPVVDESPNTHEEFEGAEPPIEMNDESSSLDTDEFGTEIPQEEMIPKSVMLERLERKNREAEHKLSQQREQIRQELMQEMQAKSSENMNESSEDWESQLKDLIVKTNQEVQQQEEEKQWRAQKAVEQSQFEDKFNKGASRYKDFESVVLGKALTPQMVLATGSMNDPAAFIYAAAKTQPKELERIAQINDPLAQATEIGRLAERMKKARSTTTSAPKPVTTVTGDVSDKKSSRTNIDDLILSDQKSRMRR